MEQLKSLLLLYGGILFFNVLFSTILWIKYSSELYRVQSVMWIGYCISFVLQGLTASGPYFQKVLAFSTILWATLNLMRLVTLVVRFPFKWKIFLPLHLLGISASALLDHLGASPTLMGLPAAITITIPGLYYTGKAIFQYRDRLTAASWGFIIVTLLTMLHALDYPYGLDKPELATTGFTVVIILAIALTTFSTAAVLETLTTENTRIRVEIEHKAVMTNSAKLAALGEMAGGIAHEINNPLAVIQMNAEQLKDLVRDEKIDREAIGGQVDTIASTVTRITKIVTGLLSFSRETGGDPFIVTPLAKIVDDTLVFCRDRFDRKEVELVLPPVTEAQVSCRPAQISQALLNLLNNAIDAVTGVAGERWVRMEIHETPSQVQLAVSDSGPGIPKEIHDKIFQPFFTTKEIGKGTGLGLSVSKGIMEAHGGDLTLTQQARGARFVITLPKSVAGPGPERQPGAS